MIRGSCLCGAVSYAVDAEPIRVHHCHCSRCRKARGAAFASNLFIPAEGLRYLDGEELLVFYRLPQAKRFTHAFCRVCGSSLPHVVQGRGYAVVPMGTLDDDPGCRPERHIFVASKASWHDVSDDLPQHEEYPP